MMKRKLRIGILLNDYFITNWAFQMIEEINNSHYAEISLIVKNGKKTKKLNLLNSIKNKLKNLLYVTYRKFDRIIYKNEISAFKLIDVRTIINSKEIIVNPIQTRYRDRISNEDVEKIRSHDVDIFLRLGFRILSGEILKASKYGIWSFHHGDNDVNRGGPPGVWEVINNWDESGVTLQILNENLDAGLVLFKSFSLTNFRSVNRNINSFYLKAISFIPLMLKKLHTNGEESFFQYLKEKNKHPNFYSNPLFKSPSNKVMFIFILKLLFNKFYEIYSKIFYINQWTILYKFDSEKNISKSFYNFKKILPPKDRFWADPHIIKKNDKYYIFIEELIYKQNKGFISVIEINNKGKLSKPVKVLENDYHLSYPFVFEKNGVYYMIPESKQNNTIDLYKSINFPYEWIHEKTLIKNISAVDSTLHYYQNKFWLFTNVVKNKGASSFDELFLFHSNELVSDDWTPHPLNPIVSDVKKARPAGNLFIHNDNLYRPSQNCSKHYGYGMQINQVLKLSEDEYEEKVVRSIYPNWDKNLFATHSLSSCDNLTVIDGCYRTSKYF